MAASYNFRRIQATIIAQGQRKIEQRVDTVLNRRFEIIKSETFNEFDDHRVTKELNENGELFGFLGFEESETPTQDVRQYLEEEINIREGSKISPRGNKIIVSKTIEIPSLSSMYEEIESEGVGEWSTKSWLQLLEDGIPFFSKFKTTKIPDSSRSKAGIQAQNEQRPGVDYPRIKYMSEILKNLKKRIMSTVKK